MYGCETWSLTLRHERKLRVFENMVFRRIFGPRRDETTGEWRRLHNEELNDLYSSPNIVRVIKSRRMRWAGHVARMCDIYGHLFWQHVWVWLFWLLSQGWISQHIWKPNVNRLMSTEILFSMPGYESLFVDQSLALNRRHDKGRGTSIEVKK